jgi:hypothetical protein
MMGRAMPTFVMNCASSKLYDVALFRLLGLATLA